MVAELIKVMLFGKSPYLGCLNNQELDAELRWLKIRESA
jgi:hypothetical protein